jgi:REP element-mobilizing transposase RayT
VWKAHQCGQPYFNVGGRRASADARRATVSATSNGTCLWQPTSCSSYPRSPLRTAPPTFCAPASHIGHCLPQLRFSSEPSTLGYTGQKMPPSESSPHSRNLRLHRQREGPGIFFVTKCLEPRKPVIGELVAAEVCSALSFYVEKKLIYLGAFVVMLDHWHVVLATADGKTVSHRVQNLGRWIGRTGDDILSAEGCHWQDGFYETRIRSAKQFQFVCAYVEENPVRAKLVKSPLGLEMVICASALSALFDQTLAMEV